MHRCIAQVEFVEQLAFVDQYETHGFTGFNVQCLGAEGDIAHLDLHRTRRAGGRCRLAEIEMSRR
jgi:hypothetical protein